MKRDVYAEVSARIVAELERGAALGQTVVGYTGQNVPQNAVTNRPYSGCNVILLWIARNRGWATPRFLTFKQAQEAGGNVRKGEHGTKVYFVKQLQVKRRRRRGSRNSPSPDAARVYGLQRRSMRRSSRPHPSRQADARAQS